MQNTPKPPVNKPVQYITIEADYAGQRIDNFLMTRLKGLPKTRVYRILRKGEVRVNKKRIQPSYRLQAGDEVRIPPMHLDEKAVPTIASKRSVALLEDRILYEDKGLLIINKPSGIPVHGGTGVSMGIIEIMRTMYPKLPQLELAHRLDAETSGCLIIAKKRSVLRELHELLRNGEVHKVYLALTKGQWITPELRVEVPLRKNHLSSGERIVRVDPEGKESLTVFAPVQTYGNGMLVLATLHTGRTHQIRVHAQYRKHPIACDEKYGDKEFNKQMRQFGLKRLFLHSHIIAFTLPSTGERIEITAPLDNDLQACLDAIR
jgi:23S rRNA pseudouridine955/2504/2580 synthase